MESTTFAILSTYDQELHTIDARNWADALELYLVEAGIDWSSLLTTRDTEPYPHATVDVYGAQEDGSVIILELEDLEVEDPKVLPVE